MNKETKDAHNQKEKWPRRGVQKSEADRITVIKCTGHQVLRFARARYSDNESKHGARGAADRCEKKLSLLLVAYPWRWRSHFHRLPIPPFLSLSHTQPFLSRRGQVDERARRSMLQSVFCRAPISNSPVQNQSAAGMKLPIAYQDTFLPLPSAAPCC